MNSTIKRYTIYLLATAILLSFISCKKLLEVPPNPSDRISNVQAFLDSANAENVMAGVYASFNILDPYGYPYFLSGAATVYPGMSADELISLDPYFIPMRTPYQNNNVLPDNPFLPELWQNAYKTIYTANAAMEGIAASPGLSAALKKQLTGELKIVRAFNYFHLVNFFGGIPLITTTDFRVNSVKPRETADKTYEFIIADLEEAMPMVTADYPSDGHSRPNLHTAQALLAKVYLYRQNWQKAADLSASVINSPLYSLETDLNNVFLSGSPEAIWQFPTSGSNYGQTNEGMIFIPNEPGLQPAYELTQQLLDDFEPDDQRKVNWTTDVEVNGNIFTIPYKYKINDPYQATTQEDYMMLRLGEQYLIHAEALAQLNKGDEALQDLNTIRERAGLSDLSFSSKDQLLTDIMHERRIELFCEWGNRWYDLKRTNQATVVLSPIKPAWQPTDVLYPIPKTELQNNPFLKQNPGY